MKNSQVNEEPFSANYGQAPEAFPSSAATEPKSFFSASPAFSSFMGTPSSLEQGVDGSTSQIYHPQPQIEELAFWQSLQKQHTNKDPPGSCHSQQPVLYHRFLDPQLKPSQNEQTNMGPPRSHHFQLPQQLLRFTEPQLQLSPWQQTNMEPPWIYHAQLPKQQHSSFTEHPLKIGGQISQVFLPQATTPTTLESFKSLWSFHNAPLIINPGKSADKSIQDASDKLRLVASVSTGKNLPKASYKGKEKVPSSSAYMESFKYPMNEPLGLAFSGNMGQLNDLYSINPQRNLSMISDITLDRGNDDPVWKAVLEVKQALQACSPPGSAIPNPYGDAGEPMFDIPFLRKTGFPNPSGSVNNLSRVPLSNNMKDSRSRKGKAKAKEKEVMNKKRRLKG